MCTLENAAELTQCDACSTSRSAGSKHLGSHSNRNSMILNPMMMNSIMNPMASPNMGPLMSPMNAMNPMINPFVLLLFLFFACSLLMSVCAQFVE